MCTIAVLSIHGYGYIHNKSIFCAAATHLPRVLLGPTRVRYGYSNVALTFPAATMDLASLIDHNNLSVMNATDDAAVANIFKCGPFRFCRTAASPPFWSPPCGLHLLRVPRLYRPGCGGWAAGGGEGGELRGADGPYFSAREELRDSDDLTVTSDADEQLLIYCPFR